MRTIQIPVSKLIKYIQSDPDGGFIPGRVIWAEVLELKRINPYMFALSYKAHSAASECIAACNLDEELDVVPHSNHMSKGFMDGFIEDTRSNLPLLDDDGLRLRFRSGADGVKWRRYDWVYAECEIPDPFDVVGSHQLSHFTRVANSHIACCTSAFGIRIAVISKDSNRLSDYVVPASEPIVASAPCQHGEGWLIPWSTKSAGINIAWLTDAEIAAFVDEANKV